MTSSRLRESFKLLLIILWLVFTVLFALWWLRFSLDNISLLARLEPEQMAHWTRQKRMIMWEGGSWIVLLVLGGGALTALAQSERWRLRRVREFFASFSHEVKTSLASLRLQAEALQDEKFSSPVLDRLIGDTVRLQLQLENSLFFASQDGLQLYVQPLSLEQLVERMREQWPSLKILLKQKCIVRADERALRTIFSNLLQNAIVHGGATAVDIQVAQLDGERLSIVLIDNGSGFTGSLTGLGQLFYRPKATSGSGLGLYICKILLKNMNGQLELLAQDKGFRVQMTLKGSLT